MIKNQKKLTLKKLKSDNREDFNLKVIKFFLQQQEI